MLEERMIGLRVIGLLLALILGVGTERQAQAQLPEMRFRRYTVDNGLSNNNIVALTQDHDGFIWVGTNHGLNRFDGYGFTTFRHDPRDSTSLSNSEISSLFTDSAGRLWVGTNDGLNLFNPGWLSFERFYVYSPEQEQPGSERRINVIFEDRSHRIWVGTSGGLFLFDPTERTFTRYRFEATSAVGITDFPYNLDYITAIFEDRDDRIWIGTAAGLNLLDSSRGTFSRFEVPGNPAACINGEVRDIVQDENGNLWVATIRNGIYILQEQGAALRQFVSRAGDSGSLPSNSIRDIHITKNNEVLVGTSEGLAVFDPTRQHVTTYTTEYGEESSLSFPSVRVILEDRDGDLWVGTWGGLNYFSRVGSHFIHVRQVPGKPSGLKDNLISSFARDPDGGIWVGTELGGLHHYDPVRHTIEVYAHDPRDPRSLRVNNVKALWVDRQGELSVGTHDGGLHFFDRESGTFQHFGYDAADSTSLAGDRVYALFEDRRGTLWIGTNKSGLCRFDRESGRFFRYQSDDQPGSISGNSINVIYEDRLGNLWIGTSLGLNLMDRVTGRFTHYLPRHQDPESLIDPNVLAIFEDSRGNLWIGTSGGLELFDRRRSTFTHFTTREGLPNDAINCILEDEDRNLWISTNQGLSRFDPVQNTFRNFDKSDGLQSSQFNRNACLATPEGDFYFGGINGFSRFRPSEITVNPHVPSVYITGFRLFNRPVPIGGDSPLSQSIGLTDEITLRHNQNVFSFDFVALNYALPGKNEYAFIMEGFEEEWNYVGSQRTATYTNLPEGSYVFRVKAANHDGVWNEEGRAIRIRVLPPPWRSWWASVIYAVVLFGLLYGIQWYARYLMRLKNRLALEQMQRRSEDELHAAKMQFFTNITHEFRTPITLILGPVDDLLDMRKLDSAGREHLKLIRRNAQRLLRLVNQLMDFRKLESGSMKLCPVKMNVVAFLHDLALSFDELAQQRQIRFDVRSTYDEIPVVADPEAMETVFVNLLSNAFKFTPESGQIAVEITAEGKIGDHTGDGSLPTGTVCITVQDSGPGLSAGDLEKVFERYYQARVPGQVVEGTGIGLALVKSIVELHGGSVSAHSEEGQGARFTVVLPIKTRSSEPEPEVAPSEIPEMHVKPLVLGEEFGSDEDSYGEEADTPDGAPVILIVEDNRDMRSYVRSCLADEFQVLEAACGSEGFRRATETIPDLVICDIMMPDLDGFALCRKLKEDLRTSHIPVILLTAQTAIDSQVEGYDIGADDYVIKPFNHSLLQVRARNLIQNRRRLRERFSLDIPLKPAESSRSTQEDVFLRKVIETVEAYLSDPEFTVEKLSREVGMSRVSLHKKLKALTDNSPSELIRKIRLKHAATLLLEGSLTVSEVAYEVGFNTPSHFSTCFRKQYGQSPSDYVAGFTRKNEDPS